MQQGVKRPSTYYIMYGMYGIGVPWIRLKLNMNLKLNNSSLGESTVST